MHLRAFIGRLAGWFFAVVSVQAAAPEGAEALLLITGDQHSAYERTAQLVAQVDRLRAEHPGLPMAMLIDGDVFEHGNVVARRSAGEIDFAMFAALARRLPTVLNLGNHEPEFHEIADTVKRVQATGVTVVSNIVNRTTGEPFVPAATRMKLGKHEAVVLGVTTDLLATFRVPVRASIELAEPVAWARRNFPGLLSHAPIRIVLSHAGLAADRGLLPLVPDGTLVAGAHDHIRFVHRAGRTAYVHSGSWNEYLTLAYLRVDERGSSWEIKQERIEPDRAGDPALAELIRTMSAKHLTPEDLAVVGFSERALSPDEAARLAVRALRRGAGVDAAFVGRTTFGAGVAAGVVTRVAFDAWVRFDGAIHVGEVNGTQLQALLSRANETPDTPFAQRQGDYLVAEAAEEILPEKSYRIAVTDWVARNPRLYLGPLQISFTERRELRLKPLVAASLAAARN
ncbi:MAG TPA: metallophosphoesterase [Opitutaceae bacterium]|nr:metallophosphoesterase [Opitutaceae bacterium]